MSRAKPFFRPLDGGWTDGKDPSPVSARFKVADRELWNDMSFEIMRLQTEADPDEFIVQLDVAETDIRVDGTGLKRGSRVGYHGVVVSFESRHGPLRFASDHYDSWWLRDAWRANIRAVTLHLQSLRAIERHGVAKSGEQYAGWKAIGPGSGDSSIQAGSMSIVDAMTILEAEADAPGAFDPRAERLSRGIVASVHRRAVKNAHPDGGGSASRFQAVQAAYGVLDRNAR